MHRHDLLASSHRPGEDFMKYSTELHRQGGVVTDFSNGLMVIPLVQCVSQCPYFFGGRESMQHELCLSLIKSARTPRVSRF